MADDEGGRISGLGGRRYGEQGLERPVGVFASGHGMLSICLSPSPWGRIVIHIVNIIGS